MKYIFYRDIIRVKKGGDYLTTPNIKANRKGKDTIFTDLFRIPRYHTELVNTIAPDINAKPKDIKLTCHVYDEQVKLYGYTKTAIEKTIYICSKEKVLKDYLEERTKEVHDIMFTLFDQDEVIKNHIAYENRIVAEKARNEGISYMVKNMLSHNIPLEQISKISGWSENQILSLK